MKLLLAKISILRLIFHLNAEFVQEYNITGRRAFPAWKPDSNDVVCAKFSIYYKSRCFEPEVLKHATTARRFKGYRKLQYMCYGLMEGLGACLRYFNTLCSKDFLKTGKGDFTPAVLADSAKKALLEFREEWSDKYDRSKKLRIERCTAFGGLCYHPKQLYYCATTSISVNSISMLLAFIIVLLLG